MNVLAKDFAQRRVKKVRRGVIALGVEAPVARNSRGDLVLGIYGRHHRFAVSIQLAAQVRLAIEIPRAGDVEAPSGRDELTDVRDLSAALHVERALVEDDLDPVVGIFGDSQYARR